MSKKSLASLELAAIINELKFLIKGKVSQIYDHGEKELVLQLHAPGQGKKLLRIIPGKLLNITEKKDAPSRPTGFCMQLRKYLDNAFISDLYQQGGERIVVFELEKQEKYFLIIEFFSKGNIIFTDSEYKIIGTLHRQIWKDRAIKPKETYLFPAKKASWKEISNNELKELLLTSEKKNLATSLAMEIGLGGVYAEEICKRVGVDKDKLPKDVIQEEVDKLIRGIEACKKLIQTPTAYFYEKEITPFPLSDIKPENTMETYNEAINTLNPLETTSPYKKKIAEINKMITQQELAIENQEQKIELNKHKGELIYENYAALSKLLQAVNELKKNNDWDVIVEELKKEKKIKKINLKKKTVVIDL